MRDANGAINCAYVRAKSGSFTEAAITSVPVKIAGGNEVYFDANAGQLREFLGLGSHSYLRMDAPKVPADEGQEGKLAKFSSAGAMASSVMTEYAGDSADYGDECFATNGVRVAGSLLVEGGLVLGSYVRPGASYRAADGTPGLTATNFIYSLNPDNYALMTNTIVIKDGLIVSWAAMP